MNKKEFDVICIGAALVDMIAKVERHPEEDDEVFVSELNMLSGGAAANTAYACAKLGLKTAFIGKLGTADIFKNKIIEDFETVNVNCDFIKYSKEYTTGTAYVALNPKGDRRIYAYSGAANYLSGQDILENEIIKARVIFLSSLKNLEPFINAAKISKVNNIPVILNPGMLIIDQGFTNISELLRYIDILILSKREFMVLFNISEKNINEKFIWQEAEKLFNLGIKSIIVTMGAKGALLLDFEKFELISSFPVKKVIDTTGAGDSFSAGFIYGFSQNLEYKFDSLKRCVEIGNYIASCCIQELGARNGIPNINDLKHFLNEKSKNF
ncbi:MAG: carbohydrate kinase family protein [Promethearchaeota archaeon]